MEQPQVHRRALGQLVKVLLGGGGVAVGFPASAAGKALAPVADKALHVLQRIAQKYPDLVGEIRRIADVLSYLYFKELNVDPAQPKMASRDRLVLSKGHAAPALYAALAERGFFPVEELKTLRKIGSRLQGHPNMNSVPGVDMSTGSLGQGISAACGMALGAKHAGSAVNVYAILGDGEVEEGECWEAFMFAAHYGLSNLCVMLDRNHLQIDGTTETVMNSAPLEDKLRAFNFNVVTINGHDFDQIESAVQAFHAETEKPTCIILDTVKGTGVSYMTNSVAWHGKGPNDEEYQVAMNELNAAYAALEQEEN